MPRTHYETLGVDKSAGMADIKAAFRTLAKRLHPDVAKKDKTTAEREFKELNEAYSTLSDPSQRALYDHKLGGGTVTSVSMDDMQSSMSDLDIFHGSPAPEQKKKKRYKNKAKRRRQGMAGVELDALPDGALDDDDLGGIF